MILAGILEPIFAKSTKTRKIREIYILRKIDSLKVLRFWVFSFFLFSDQKLLVIMNMQTNLKLLHFLCNWWKKMCIAFYYLN